ncbi:sulfotransferase family protein [Mycobacterium intracellulare]|uniref:sulfotransferase family protein n=1 Tax=Mycobacterium intracellulare TaxID=1767 RepID=UPI000B8D17D1|nr:sulfotransferase family protein [Mycobacterium intracellulare]ASQ87055.1 sulfotransferase family protein [Mycobacterium intracellulare subsp. chimaera]MCF1812575.1 sulfotransferase family protein [Mycobacterium intracellulare subsp. intracellulare]MDS0336307.1 sulfotransferase family protein [Mycobacterium intracellulare]
MRLARMTKPVENAVTSSNPLGSGNRPVALFVLGPQRSGTSALTRVLSLCGGTLPAAMLGADANNPLGYWEPRAAISLNETILRRLGTNWYDPSLRFLDHDAATKENKVCVAKVTQYLSTLPAAPLVVIKEPRITTLSELWFEAAREAGFDVAAVIAVRHPQEVISSIAKSWHVSPALASALWLKCNILAERNSRGVPRVFVDYANLLEDWRREMKRISAQLPVELHSQDEDAVDGFLTPGLHRQRHCGAVVDLFGANWISTVYQALRGAAQDDPIDISALDGVFHSYRASERDFRKAFEDAHALTNSVLFRLFRPSIARPVMEVIAMAHRHRGTWA